MDGLELFEESRDEASASSFRDAFELPLTPEKAEIIIRLIYRYEALAKAAQAAKQKAAADQSIYEEREEFLRVALRALLEMSNMKKLKTEIGTASVTPAKEKIEVAENITDFVLDWPADVYMACVSTPVVVNKAEIKKLPPEVLEKLGGVSVVMGQPSLRIA